MNVNKNLAIFVAASTLAMTAGVVADSGVQTVLDGRLLQFDQPAMMQSGRVMVPLRGIFESLGATVLFDPATRTIKATKEGRVVELTLGSRQARINGETSYLDVPAATMGGRTLVPLRFVSQALGADVRWNPATRTVALTSQAGGGDLSNIPSSPPVQPPTPAALPQLSNLVHNARRPLNPGDRLVVSVNGDSGGQASFDLLGVVNGVPMREVSNGKYEGEYLVQQGTQVQSGTLVVRLRKGGQEGVLESARAVSIRNNNQNNNNNNNNQSSVSPQEGSVVNTSRPTVQANLDSALRQGSTRVFMDGNEVTNQSSVVGSSVHYVPNYDLTAGNHRVLVQGIDYNGRQLSREWNFSVYNNNGNNNGNNNNNGNYGSNLSISNPYSGSNVGASFNVQGQTRPYAQVQIVAQSQRSLIPGVIGFQNRVASATQQADSSGRFSIQLDVSRVPVNTPISLEIQSADNNGNNRETTQVDVVRR